MKVMFVDDYYFRAMTLVFLWPTFTRSKCTSTSWSISSYISWRKSTKKSMKWNLLSIPGLEYQPKNSWNNFSSQLFATVVSDYQTLQFHICFCFSLTLCSMLLQHVAILYACWMFSDSYGCYQIYRYLTIFVPNLLLTGLWSWMS